MLRGRWRTLALLAVVLALAVAGCQPRAPRELTIVQSVAAVTLDPHHHDKRAVEGSPFRDPRLREATDLAIDREALVARGQAGLGAPLDQLVPPEVAGHARGLPTLRSDPARARTLIAEAGFPQGLDVAMRVSDMLEPAGRELARQLAMVGLRVTVEVLPTKEFFARWSTPGAPLVVFGYSAATGDAKSLFDPLVRAPRGGLGEVNTFAYDSPRLEALLDRMVRAQDAAPSGRVTAGGSRQAEPDARALGGSVARARKEGRRRQDRAWDVSPSVSTGWARTILN